MPSHILMHLAIWHLLLGTVFIALEEVSFISGMDARLDNNSTRLTTETPNCTTVIHPYHDIEVLISRYLDIFSITLGIPGNILAFLVWIRPRMCHSSGFYMALLALTQTMMLGCKIILDLQQWWNISLLQYRGVCELFPALFYLFQYLDPLLYLAFTVERYISVCHPFQRSQLCTTRRAIYVSISLACFSLATSSIQAYFYTYDDVYGCTLRSEVMEMELVSVLSIWSYITESLYFLLVPIAVFVLNICVIRTVSKSRNQFNVRGNNISKSSGNDKTAANSKLLLYVSFYFIICVLPVSILYVFQMIAMFPLGAPCVVEEEDSTWNTYYRFSITRTIVESVSLLHFALNFYIYMFIGKVFRNEFCKMMSCCKPLVLIHKHFKTETHTQNLKY